MLFTFPASKTSLTRFHVSSVKKQQTHKHEAEEYVRFVAVNATPRALTTRTVEEASAADDELKRDIQAMQVVRPHCQ